MSGELVLGLFLFIGAAIPIIGALWKVFSIREELKEEIKENRHQIALGQEKLQGVQKEINYRFKLLDVHSQSLVDKLQLGIHQTKELVGHVRERSQKNETALSSRLSDLEGYLEKSTDFIRRHTDP